MDAQYVPADNICTVAQLKSQLTHVQNQNKSLKDLTLCHLDLIEKQKKLISKQNEMYCSLQEEIAKLKAKLIERDKRTELRQRYSIPTSTITSRVINKESIPSEAMVSFRSSQNKPLRLISIKTNKRPVSTLDRNLQSAVIKAPPLVLDKKLNCDDFKIKDYKNLFIKKQVKTNVNSEAKCTITSNSFNLNDQRIEKNKEISSIDNYMKKIPKRETLTSKSNLLEQDQGYESTYSVNEKKNLYGKPQNTSTVLEQSNVKQPHLDLGKTETHFTLPIADDKSFSNAGNIAVNNSVEALMPTPGTNELSKLLTTDSALSFYCLDEPLLEMAPKETTKVEVADTTTVMAAKKDTGNPNYDEDSMFHEEEQAFPVSNLVKNEPTKSIPKRKSFRGQSRLSQDKKSPIPNLITTKPYHTLVGDPDCSWYLGLDPELHPEDVDPPSFDQASSVEVPHWRVKTYKRSYILEGTENLNDNVFIKRHSKPEAKERQVLRRHRQRVREERYMERLRERQREMRNSPVTIPPVYTLWPKPQSEAHFIEITPNLPVNAFGEPIPQLPESNFKLPWVRTPKTSKKSKKHKTLHG